MTYNEYINQTNPLKCHCVEVDENDCEQTYSDGKNTIIVLKMFGELFTYILVDKITYKAIYTMDADGNPNKHSCFNWVGK